MSALQELEQSVQAAAGRVGPAVVGLGRGWGVGSGVGIGPGRVLTNAHNPRHEERSGTFHDGTRATGRVTGAAPDPDIPGLEGGTAEPEPVLGPEGAGEP